MYLKDIVHRHCVGVWERKQLRWILARHLTSVVTDFCSEADKLIQSLTDTPTFIYYQLTKLLFHITVQTFFIPLFVLFYHNSKRLGFLKIMLNENCEKNKHY